VRLAEWQRSLRAPSERRLGTVVCCANTIFTPNTIFRWYRVLVAKKLPAAYDAQSPRLPFNHRHVHVDTATRAWPCAGAAVGNGCLGRECLTRIARVFFGGRPQQIALSVECSNDYMESPRNDVPKRRFGSGLCQCGYRHHELR